MAASQAWKDFERKVAKSVGGKRRGPVREGSKECDDVIHEDVSFECKWLSRPSFGAMLDAAKQAERNCPPGKIPLAVIGRKGTDFKDALIVMRFEKFLEEEDFVPELPDIEATEAERFDAQQFVVPATAKRRTGTAHIQYDFDDPSDIDPGVIGEDE